MSAPPALPQATTPARPGRVVLRGGLTVVQVLLMALLGLALVLAAAAGGVVWLLTTQSGLAATLGVAQRFSAGALQVEGARGRLLGPLEADAVRYRSDDGEVLLAGVKLAWQPVLLLHGRLHIDQLDTTRVTLLRPAAAGGQGAAQQLDAVLSGAAVLDIDWASARVQGPLRLRNQTPRALEQGGLPVAALDAVLDWHGADIRLDELAVALQGVAAAAGAAPLEGRLAGRLAWQGATQRLADVALELQLAGNRLAASGALGAAQDTLQVRIEAPALAALGLGLSGRAGAEGAIGGTRRVAVFR